MFWKTFLVATLAVGVLAQYQLNDDQRAIYRDYLKQNCKKNGAEDKVDTVVDSVMTYYACMNGLFNEETLKKVIEEAKPNGALGEEYKNYCAKAPQLKSCLRALWTGVAPCLDENSRGQVGLVNLVNDYMIDFACYKDGDRMALFIAEKGPECVQQKASDIQECFKKTSEGINAVEEANKLSSDEKCAKYDEMAKCIVTALEQCSTPTPGNMAESLFRYIRNSTDCFKSVAPQLHH